MDGPKEHGTWFLQWFDFRSFRCNDNGFGSVPYHKLHANCIIDSLLRRLLHRGVSFNDYVGRKMIFNFCRSILFGNWNANI
eukprot:jgi/Galph1/5755/GphlegSOOS_G4412.1